MSNPFNIFRKKDARALQTAQKELNPTKEPMSYKNALATVDTLGESKSGRRKLRGLRASGQLQDIGDWRKQKKATKKATKEAARIKKKAAREMDPNYALDYMKKNK